MPSDTQRYRALKKNPSLMGGESLEVMSVVVAEGDGSMSRVQLSNEELDRYLDEFIAKNDQSEEIELFLPEAEMFTLMKLAHEKDITFNDLIIEIIMEQAGRILKTPKSE